ncbi:uncharacterized protein HMPREF1541_01232 [Cyphellophora europaea CBS 101466]|uniref:Phosphatidylserine decarboxylase n=1 Tax=Cyphellophora europaea (strain CBS 101466) TaxID=1220924 RepID=W2SEC2_CYPE1|nr:uncharacterized protein HMPREF1541_01232 [Cyphellophora europaea CBS 101466]ETN47042.1 hypothetical protein HMPREF1541_01232 [Cyphellophora europaea CBS 101466]
MASITFPPVPELPIHPYVQYLRSTLVKIDRLKDLEKAIRESIEKDQIVEFTEWGITDASRFFQYASYLLTSWIPSETQDGRFVYYVLTIFYYVFDKASIEDLQTPIAPTSIQGDMPIITPVSNWITGFAVRMGQWLDTPDSLTPASYQSFVHSPPYRVGPHGDYHIPDPADPRGGFKTFNELFCRRLRCDYPYTGVRPIAGPKDPNVVIFPADSTFDGAFPIDSNNTVEIKGLQWPISALLAGSEYADSFAGGTWAHAFLNTFDYHRQHAPVAGTVVEASNIEGLCYLQVIAKDDEHGHTRLKPHRGFRSPANKPRHNGDVVAQPDAPDEAGYEFIQTRGLIIIKTGRPEVGLVAVLPMGMAQVSSVKLAVRVNQELKKGEEISHFEFGGSDIVLVFEKKAGVDFSKMPLKEHHFMGEQLATFNPAAAGT